MSEFDTVIADRLRRARVLKGLSQRDLAQSAGITFQQIQKYETGKNRISSSRLYEFAKFLDVDVNYFYIDLEELHTSEVYSVTLKIDDKEVAKDIHDLADILSRTQSTTIRKKILELAKILTSSGQ